MNREPLHVEIRCYRLVPPGVRCEHHLPELRVLQASTSIGHHEHLAQKRLQPSRVHQLAEVAARRMVRPLRHYQHCVRSASAQLFLVLVT